MRFGPFRVLVTGQVVIAIALLALALGPEQVAYARDLLLPMALLGLGGGLSFPALTMIAMADVSPEDAGLASGLLNTTGEVGGAFGLAVLATIAGGRTLDMVNQGADLTVALSDGYHLAWMVCAGLLVLTLAAVVVLLRVKTAEQVMAVDDPCVECEAAA
jgi:nitrate/nitrite transporter NarK